MKKVQGVSYPRSGHHLLVELLSSYLGDDFKYCDFYDCCRSIPCKHPETTFQKNHDRNLWNPSNEEMKIHNKSHYLIQFRNPVESITSDFNLKVKVEKVPLNKKEWTTFALRSIEYWMRFIQKWVMNKPEGALLLSYHELITSPERALGNVLDWMEVQKDQEKIAEVIRAQGVGKKRELTDFTFFDESFFYALEYVARKEMRAAKVPFHFVR